MIDKDKFKAEIERLYHTQDDIHVGADTADKYYARGYKFACKEILAVIDSKQVSPASEDLEKAAEEYANQHNELLGFDCYAEPIQTGPEIKRAVVYGANWQKQQMLKDTVEAEVWSYLYGNKIMHTLLLTNDLKLKVGSKVKLIITKEE